MGRRPGCARGCRDRDLLPLLQAPPAGVLWQEKRAVTLTHPAGGESLIFRSFAYLRCRGKRIVGRGDLVSFVVRDGGAGASATLSLNGRPAPLKAAEGRVRYSR